MPERHERQLRIREFQGLTLAFEGPPAELRDTDPGAPGELFGRVVPWNTPTPIGRDVMEVFEPGALDKTLAEHRNGIKLFSTHDTRSRQPIGSIRQVENREDGQWIRFSLNRTTDANDARELIRTGDANGLSVGFYPVQSYDREADGVTTIIRKEAILDHVALVSRPAYPTAQVAQAREEEAPPEPEPLIEVLSTPKLDSWKEMLGIE